MKTQPKPAGLIEKAQRGGYLFRRSYSTHEPGQPVIALERVALRYQSGAALEDVTLSVRAGERLAVVGPNGAGKSTLFKIVAGVIQPSEGQVNVYGHTPGEHICIAYVPQRSTVDWNFPASVEDVVMMGRTGHIGLFRWPSRHDWQIVHEALALVGLESYARRQLSQLSGGQQQRMFIARALAQEAELVLLDEPLTGLDVSAQEKIFEILDTLRRRGVTVLVSLHDLKIAAEHFDRIVLLNRRLIAFGEPAQVLSAERLVQAYGDQLRLVPADGSTLAIGDTCCDEGHTHD